MPTVDVLDLLTRVVEKSLAVAEEQGSKARYHMLETIRQYGREKLSESGESASMRTRHLGFFVHRSDGFDEKFYGPQQVWWLNKFEIELDNVRTAIEWSLESHSARTGMRLTGALMYFWFQRHPGEGLEHIRKIVALPEASGHFQERVAALNCKGFLETFQGNSTAALRTLEEALTIAQELGDESIIAISLLWLGQAAQMRGEHTLARASLSEALVRFRKIDRPFQIAWTLWLLADETFSEDNIEQAQTLYEELAVVMKSLRNNTLGLSIAPRRLGQIALQRGEHARADTLIRESLTLNIEAGDKRGVAACIAALAALSAARGRAIDAVRLLGSVDALLESIHTEMYSVDRDQYARNSAALRTQLDPATFNTAWAEGRSLSMEQAIAEAMRPVVADTPAGTAPHGPDDLSPREREVLSLVAAGLSDAQVADKLVVSPRTVNAHLTTIYRKLGVNSRSAATRYALDHKLV